jgi:tripartite-type tricarboxylate transporter receptor subunit TctC
MEACVVMRFSVLGVALLAGHALAQTYPAKPIRVIVAFAPGGGTDILARATAQKLTEAWGQSVVVENRPGAGGNIGTELVARAQPDGHTLLATSSGPFVISQNLYSKLPFDPVKDFAPITLAVNYAYLLVAHNSVPARSIRELIALAKARPGRLTCGSGGLATPPHLATELFKMMSGTDITHIPFKGTGAALTDALGGHVDLLFGNLPSQLPHVRNGRLRALGISSEKRSELLPQVPTISESGVKGFEASSWFGWFAPASTPPPVIGRVHGEIARIMHGADMKPRLLNEGAEPVVNTPEQFVHYMRVDSVKWARVIKDARIKAE